MTADGYAVLTTLGEAGGIASIVAVILGVLIKMMKKNGCTCKCYNCNGDAILEMDCEEGAPGKRYLPKLPPPSTPSQSDTPPPSIPDVNEVIARVVRPRDVNKV